MRTTILAGLAVLNLGAAARPAEPPHKMTFVQQQQCGVPEVNLRGICVDIRSKDQPRYERKVNTAACVTGEMSQDEAKRRIALMWAAYRPTCGGGAVGVDGDIIKYAVSARTFDFVMMSANIWCMDLNSFDNPRGQTVLDFTIVEMGRSVSAGTILQPYYDQLRDGGALTRAEAEALGPNYPRMRTECTRLLAQGS